jgi:hypothetical protein
MGMSSKTLPVRGYLIHLTHYDPVWVRRKPREKPFDLELGLEIVEALAADGFNLLVIDCADGVKYKSHPELAKRYTIPMKQLETLAAAARGKGLEVAPKLNFSRSQFHHHNTWLLAPGEQWHDHFDDEAYWRKAFEVVDELIAVCRPKRFFHVGMDEDHDRSYTQYVEAIKTLHDGLKKRKLRTIIWNDTMIRYASGMIHAEKSLAAEKAAPRDIVEVVWCYDRVPEDAIRRVGKAGFELWGAPGWRQPSTTAAFRSAVARAGGKGLLMTTWMPCRPRNRRVLLESISMMGPIYHGEG